MCVCLMWPGRVVEPSGTNSGAPLVSAMITPPYMCECCQCVQNPRVFGNKWAYGMCLPFWHQARKINGSEQLGIRQHVTCTVIAILTSQDVADAQLRGQVGVCELVSKGAGACRGATGTRRGRGHHLFWHRQLLAVSAFEVLKRWLAHLVTWH